jgi:hypothetical protein
MFYVPLFGVFFYFQIKLELWIVFWELECRKTIEARMPGGTFGLVGDYGCSDSEGESGEDDPAAPQTTASNSVNSAEDDGDDKGIVPYK